MPALKRIIALLLATIGIAQAACTGNPHAVINVSAYRLIAMQTIADR